MSSSPAPPLLRPPVPGGNRNTGGARTPRLGLAIPPSPNQKPVNGDGANPPSLRLSTPGGGTTQGAPAKPNGGLKLQISGSNDGKDGKASGPSSASSASQSALSLNTGAKAQGSTTTTDPSSAISSLSGERDGSVSHVLPDLEKLTLEKGRDLDVDDLTDDDAWMAASKAGRIEELGTLGEGAGGAVTKCRLKGGKTIFALKVITTDPDPDMQRQIKRELEFNRKIAAANICKYYGAFGESSSGVISLVMEYCEGGSLDSIYKEVKKLKGRIGEKVLGKVADGVLEGLTALYSYRIIHRDIKPSNVLLCRDGRVKLCDFGVSGEFGTRGDADTFIGTSYYMAPERITGQSYTINSDVWSLGVTLLEVAQHRFPFPADGSDTDERPSLIDIIQYIVGQPLPQLKDEPAKEGEPEIKWSDNFKYFIDCCLEKEPKRRATPWRMLEHPWMVDMKSKKVNMETFLQQVWDWKEE